MAEFEVLIKVKAPGERKTIERAVTVHADGRWPVDKVADGIGRALQSRAAEAFLWAELRGRRSGRRPK